VNLHGTINLIDALRETSFAGSFLYVSSGDVYGSVTEQALPIREDLLPKPRNPYSASKVAAEAYCQQAAVSFGFRVIIARPFNHIGAGQSDRFVLPAMAKQISEIKKGLRSPVIEAGNVDVTRDFSDVRDVVRAYLQLLATQTSGEIYNVCSGVEYNVGSVLLRMLELSGVKAEIKVMEQKVRRNEQRRHCGSNEKLRQATGWTPAIPFEQALQDLLASWKILK
jgi:GDP-4-dehydro-6-deoxy-D-mannose reductase